MPRLSNSQGERISQLKNRQLARFHTAYPTVPESSPATTFSSTLTARRQGQAPQIFTPTHGVPYEVSGCCCLPVCDFAEEPTVEIILVADISGTEDDLSDIYGRPITIPPPPLGYGNSDFLLLNYPVNCYAKEFTVRLFDSIEVPCTQYDLGIYTGIQSPYITDGGFIVIYPAAPLSIINNIELTESNACGSVTTSFTP